MPKPYLDKLKLENRVAVITGGSQGIGLSCAEALAEAGAKVIIADVSEEHGARGRSALRGRGYDSDSVVMDVTNSRGVEQAAQHVAQKYGRVDILVNNAGVARSGVPAESTSDEHWRFHMAVNLDGVFFCCREFGKLMLAQGSGAIVNIGSMSGFIANKPQQQVFYNASKAAVHHLTRSLAAEWASRGVRVNAVAPTYVETPLTAADIAEAGDWHKTWLDMTPMGRVGQPDEIASVVHFLASDAASLMTGSIVLADGGYCCW